MDFKLVPELRPSAEAQVVGPEFTADDTVLGFVVQGFDVRVEHIGIQADVEGGVGTVGNVELTASLVVFVQVE